MSRIDPHLLKNSVAVTVGLMTLGALFGVILGQIIVIVSATGSLVAVATLGALPAIFMIAAQQSLIMMILVPLVPIWAIIGGYWFAKRGKEVAPPLGITFFGEDHTIHRRVNELAQELALPPIKWVGYFEDTSINAFAYGVDQTETVLAFSRPAVEDLTKAQFDAVVAHELAHVAMRDMARMTYAEGVQEALTWFLVVRGFKNIARWLFTPLSQMELLRFSRKREFYADAVAAVLVSPEAITQVLAILKERSVAPAHADRDPKMMFFGLTEGLLRTHPTNDARIYAIRNETYIKRLPLTAEYFGEARWSNLKRMSISSNGIMPFGS